METAEAAFICSRMKYWQVSGRGRLCGGQAQGGGLRVNGAKSRQELRGIRTLSSSLSEFFVIAEAGIFEVAQTVLNETADIIGIIDAAKPGGVEVLRNLLAMF
jgi:hypothetical protein